MRQQADEVFRSAAPEPVIVDSEVEERVEETERVVNVIHGRAEMVSVILPLEYGQHLIHVRSVCVGHVRDGLREVLLKFLLRDAAQGLVLPAHADVVGLVETAEDTYLRELGHACEEHELQVVP